MRGRTVGIAAGCVVLLGGVVVLVGPGLYADYANDRAAPPPTLGASAGAGAALGDPAALDGTWTEQGGSFAGYRTHEVLRGEDVTVTGRTTQVDASLTVADGTLTAATITVDMADVATDEPARDAYFRSSVVDVSTFPTATFTLTTPVALPADAGRVDLVGDLTVRGVTRSVTVQAQVARDVTDGADVRAVGSVPVTFADFGVTPPSLGFVRVDDQGDVEFGLDLGRAS